MSIKDKLNTTTENLIDFSEKYTVKFDFSIENLIQVKKVLQSKNISLKEFVSFVMYMVEHYQFYHEFFELVTNEIQNLKVNNKLKTLDSFNKNKKNIYSSLEMVDPFKKRQIQNNNKEKDEHQETNNKETSGSEDFNKENYEKEYENYINLISKFKESNESLE